MKTPPSFEENSVGAAVSGLIRDLAITYMVEQIVKDEERMEYCNSAHLETHLNFGESILQHYGEEMTVVPLTIGI